MHVNAYAALKPKETLVPFQFELGEPGADKVQIQVTHCGLCRSDLDALDNRFGNAPFPLVAGHEIVGTVRARGAAVRHLSIGQRVGVGPLCNACLQCELCLDGRDNLCSKMEMTIGGGNRGGFADVVEVPAAFAFPLPESLPSAAAAPLLCAGLTVYSPLRRHTSSASRVGVIGIGGLGHLALQFAAKRGSEVTAISTSARKAADARRFGAHHFIESGDPEQLRKAAGSLDFILSTVDADLNFMDYLNLLRPDGKICVVGASLGAIGIPAGMLIMGQYSLVGSAAGSRATAREMLDFSARHQIAAESEILPIAQVNDALARLRSGKAPFRIVLTHQAAATPNA
jgi:uncharacterized zinc-type alcohol dehydrogenase-like protein